MDPALKLLEEPSPSAAEHCHVTSVLGITALLRSVAAAGPRAAAYLEDGETFIHTCVLGLQEKPPRLVFEKSADPELNRRVLNSPQLTFVTSDYKVPVQFVCDEPALTCFEGVDAFSAGLPNRVLRLQRRGAYRLEGAPLLDQIACRIFLDGKTETNALRPAVIDVSCGGISIAVPASGPDLVRESRHRCRVDLPGFMNFDVTMMVHGSREYTLPGGIAARRYGIEFVNLDAAAEVLLQRFITEEQRSARKARV